MGTKKTYVIEATLAQMKEDYDWKDGVFGYAGANNAQPVPAFKGKARAGKAGTFTLDDVKKVIASKNGQNDQDSWFAVFQLKDGCYASIEASCDYTGWDCQSGGNSWIGDTLKSVVDFGLSEEGRRVLGFNK